MRNYLFLRKMKDHGCLKIISFLSINRKDSKNQEGTISQFAIILINCSYKVIFHLKTICCTFGLV